MTARRKCIFIALIVDEVLLSHHRIAHRLEFAAGFPFRKFVAVGDLAADFE